MQCPTRRTSPETRVVDRVIIRFAGDSGDGMQLTGDRFTSASALFGNDLATLPDFPAEIRAPAGTLAGVSAFQVHISDHEITTPGDAPNVLVAMNPAALAGRARRARARRHAHRQHRHLRRAQPHQGRLRRRTRSPTAASTATRCYEVPMTSLTKEAVEPLGVKPRDAERSKNFFALGLVSWMYTRPVEPTLDWIEQRFGPSRLVRDANTAAFKAGHAFGETAELFDHPYEVKPADAAARHLHEHQRQHRAGLGPRRRRPAARACRCSSARTRSRRRPTSSTSCRSTRTSACARCRPRTRSPASARRSAPPSAATSASPPRAARASRSRARPWAWRSASSCRC